jgi:N-acetylmuramoyl-L-alanine amidase
VDEEISLLGDETATEEVAEASETEVETEEPEETEETEEGETEEEEESSEEGGTAYITGDEVNVREEPTTDNGDDNVMFTLLEGDEVKILDREDNWVKISVDGEVGWVSSAYVE